MGIGRRAPANDARLGGDEFAVVLVEQPDGLGRKAGSALAACASESSALPRSHARFAIRMGLIASRSAAHRGFRRAHVHAGLDEFVFRWSRRRHLQSTFAMQLGIGLSAADRLLVADRTGMSPSTC
jgi:GGDEF domain-containing protein